MSSRIIRNMHDVPAEDSQERRLGGDDGTDAPDIVAFVSNRRMAGFCRSEKSRCARAYVLGTSAKKLSKELFPKDRFSGNEADVFRHVYWHALMMIDGMPADWVTQFGEQWEIWPGNRERAKKADLENNAFGRRVGTGIAAAGLPAPVAMRRAETYVQNMVRNRGKDLNFDF